MGYIIDNWNAELII